MSCTNVDPCLRVRWLSASFPYLPGEDLWHVFNLVRDGDHLTATTFRKVAVDSGLGGESERIKMKLTLEVEGVDFDPEGKV